MLETLKGKGLFPAKSKSGANGGSGRGMVTGAMKRGSKEDGLPRDLDVLRVGIGIGRPAGREKDAVADYVLREMEGRELDAVARAAESVVDVLEEEMFRVG